MFKQFLDKFLCSHRWQEERKINIFAKGDSGERGDYPMAFTYFYICTKCGKFKKVNS